MEATLAADVAGHQLAIPDTVGAFGNKDLETREIAAAMHQQTVGVWVNIRRCQQLQGLIVAKVAQSSSASLDTTVGETAGPVMSNITPLRINRTRLTPSPVINSARCPATSIIRKFLRRARRIFNGGLESRNGLASGGLRNNDPAVSRKVGARREPIDEGDRVPARQDSESRPRLTCQGRGEDPHGPPGPQMTAPMRQPYWYSTKVQVVLDPVFDASLRDYPCTSGELTSPDLSRLGGGR